MTQESSLIKTSEKIRKYIIFFVAFVVLYYAGQFAIKILTNIQDNQITTNYSPFSSVNNDFEDIQFPDIKPNIEIDDISPPIFTLSDNFKNYPDRVFVYKVSIPEETFLTVSKAKQIARTLGFAFETGNKDDSSIDWVTENRTLSFDKNKLTWLLKSNEEFRSSFDDSNKIIQLDTLSKKVSEVVIQFDAQYLDLYNFQKPDIHYVEPDENSLLGFVKTDDESSSFVMFNYFQYIRSLPTKDTEKAINTIRDQEYVDEIKIVGENPFIPRLEFVFNQNELSEELIVDLKYSPIKIEKDPAIYKIISPKEAYTNLQQNQGSLRSIYTDKNQILINSPIYNVVEFNINANETELGYFVPSDFSENTFTFPVYIFKGTALLSNNANAEFVFYINALETL